MHMSGFSILGMVASMHPMAKKMVTTTIIVDDLDGLTLEEGQAESVRFSLDNTNYEIDLSKQNAQSLRDLLSPYLKAASVVASRRAPSGAKAKSNKNELTAAREWLRKNGQEVSGRGRIKGDLMELYRVSN